VILYYDLQYALLQYQLSFTRTLKTPALAALRGWACALRLPG